ncbi:MAG: PQQ-dependent sugar dehydrogenase [Patescibacteria group bacterium]
MRTLLWAALAAAILIGAVLYFNLWGIASQIIPLIELSKRVEVSEPSAFTVPEGFRVEVYASGVPGARVLIRDPKGALLVSQTSEGQIVALPDKKVILDGLSEPHGLALIGDILYVAEEGAVKSYAYNADTKSATYLETIAVLPTDGGHSTRTLIPSHDNTSLLVSVGSSCNVCNEADTRRATIMEIDLKSKEASVYARGLRNTVFMAYELVTGELWGTDMGRDLLGDDTPPDEINILKKGGNYGWPTCYGKNVHDTEFDQNTYIRAPCSEPFEQPSVYDIPAHSAPLGIAFAPEEGWPEEYWLDALVAYHGSWNRSLPSGYKVVRVVVDERGMPTGEEQDFMTGFITDDGDVIGRPVGLLAEPGGVLYISDDRAGAVYRVSLIHEAR